MPIAITDRIVALIDHTCRATIIEALPPAERRLLADQCRHVAKLADGQPQPKAGLLSALQTRPRDE